MKGTLKVYWGGDTDIYPQGMRQIEVKEFAVSMNGTISFRDKDGDKRIIGNVPFDFIESKDNPIPEPSKYVSPIVEGGMW